MKHSMIKSIAIILSGILICIPIYAMNYNMKTLPTKNTMLLESNRKKKKTTDICSFSIENTNELTLRDIRSLLNFRTNWNREKKAVGLTLTEFHKESPKNPSKNKIKIIVPTSEKIAVHNQIQTLTVYSMNDYLLIKKNTTPSLEIKPEVPEAKDNFLSIKENNATYTPRSKDYSSIEKYFIENVDDRFKIKEYTVTESSPTRNAFVYTNNPSLQKYSKTSIDSVNVLDIIFCVNGYKANFGYRVYVFSGYAKLIYPIGKWNNNFDISEVETFPYSDEQLKQMCLNKDGFQNRYTVNGIKIHKYFDMETLKLKAEVEIAYKDNNGCHFILVNVF